VTGRAVAAVEPPAADAPREELLRRDRAQREEVAALRARLAALGQGAASAPATGHPGPEGGR
jgi:hypothetical protein